MAATSINCLAVVLKELDWSYSRLIAELRRQAAVDAIVLPKTESLIPLISRWVNNHQQPDDFYRELLSRATGRHRFELFSDEAAVALLAARTNSGIAPIVAVGSDEDMNRRQLLARTAALAAALAADPLVSMSGTTTPAGGALIEAQAAPVGGAERDVVAAIRRASCSALDRLQPIPCWAVTLTSWSSIVASTRLGGFAKAPATWSLARCFPRCSLTPRSPVGR